MQQTELQLFRLEVLRHINRMFDACAGSDDLATYGIIMFEVCWLKARLETYEQGSPIYQDSVYNQTADALINARHRARVEASNNSSIGATSVPDTTNG